MMKMTRAEMEQRLKELKTREFYINMVDHWTREDKENLARVKAEIAEIEDFLKK